MLRFLKILNKPKGKPLKRIEVKAHSKKSRFKIRGSRTSGINAAIHPLKGLTFNTKHGLRLSKTFKGLTLGFQRGNPIVRGWWKIGKNFNLNLSKSGFSFSVSSNYGTFNFKNPNRSSFKFAGIQLRGKKAKGLAFIFAIPNIIAGIFSLIVSILKLFLWLAKPLLFIAYWILFIFLWVANIFFRIFVIIFIILFTVLVIWPFNIVKNLLSIALIDIPIQIINNIAGRELLIENEPSYKKISAKQLHENDEVAYELLLERLEFYDDKNLKEYNSKEKFFYWILFFAGFLVSTLGIFIIAFSVSVASWLYGLIGIYLTLIGNEMKEPVLRVRRQKEDLKLNQEFNIR